MKIFKFGRNKQEAKPVQPNGNGKGPYRTADPSVKPDIANPLERMVLIPLEGAPFLISAYTVTNGQVREAVNDRLYKTRKYWSKEGWQIKEKNKWEKPGSFEKPDSCRFLNAPDKRYFNHGFRAARTF